MRQHLVAIHHPDNYDPYLEDEAMERDIDVLNDEMVAAGVMIFRWRPPPGKQRLIGDARRFSRVFSGGLSGYAVSW